MKRFRRLGLLVFSAMMVLALLAGCAAPAATPTTAPAPAATKAPAAAPTTAPAAAPTTAAVAGPAAEYKIGLIDPLSGPAAPWGLDMDRTVKLQAEKANAAGGLQIGGKTYKFTVISEDDQGKASNSVTIANKLIFQDKVNVIAGAVFSDSTLAIQSVTEPNNIPLLAYASSYTLLGEGKSNTLMPLFDGVSGLYAMYFKYFQEKMPNVKKLAIIAPNNETGKCYLDSFKMFAEYFKYDLVDANIALIDPTTTDYAPILTKLIAAKVDLIEVTGMAGVQVSTVSKQAREMGYTGIVAAGLNVQMKQFIASGPGAEGVYLFKWADEGPNAGPGMAQFKSDFVARWGADAFDDTYSPMAFFPVIIDGLKTAGTIDPKALVPAILSKKTVDTPAGPAVWAGKDVYDCKCDRRLWMGSLAFGQVKNGKYNPLLTLSGQEQYDLSAMVKKAWDAKHPK